MPSARCIHDIEAPSGALVLGHNEFYGHRRTERAVSGFTVAQLRADPAARVLRHSHETAHFILLLDGAYVTTARHAPAICTRRTLIYNPPGTTHRDRFADGGVENGRFLSIAIDAARLAGAHEKEPLFSVPTCIPNPEALAIANRIAQELRSSDRAAPMAQEALCLELLAHAVRSNSHAERESPRWLALAASMLRDRCLEDVTIAEVASVAGVHPVHLARSFRRFLFCSPGDYLRRCRIERAAQLLRETQDSLARVALMTGFVDQSHFTKAFVAAFDLTPRAYRQSLHPGAEPPDQQVA